MSKIIKKLMFMSLLFATFQVYAEKNEEITNITTSFINAFKTSNLELMNEHFSDKLTFEGDKKFNKKNELNKEEMLESYAILFDKVSKLKKWSEVMTKIKPTLVQAKNDSEILEPVKVGDYIFDINFKEATGRKRSKRTLDEAVIFVFRKVEGKYRIVHHFADY